MELKLHDSSENRRMKAIRKSFSGVLCLVLFFGSGIAAAQPLVFNETPAGNGEVTALLPFDDEALLKADGLEQGGDKGEDS